MTTLLTLDHIFTNIQIPGKAEALALLAEQAVLLGITDDAEQYVQDTLLREAQFTTNMGQGIAIPHCKSSCVKHPAVMVFRLLQPIAWDDNDPVEMIINLAVPCENASIDHLKILSGIAKKLADDELLDQLKAARTKEELCALLQ